MSKEAMKLALEALNAATRYGAGGFEDAKDALREALAKPDFWEGYVPEPVKPAPPECQTEAEKTAYAFGWWKALESQRALDKKAENARELGLDYEPAQQEPVACECHRCIDEKGLNVNGLPLSMTKMILCPKCGNKRCPKASDHRLTCTNSNDPGQPGSIYTSPPAQQEPFGYFRYDLRLDAWVQNKAGLTGTPFYTSPPAQRKPLTDDEIWREYRFLWPFHPAEERMLASDILMFARAIEAAHGIKENT